MSAAPRNTHQASGEDQEVISKGLIRKELSMETVVFGEVPDCQVGDETVLQGHIEESCPCSMKEDGRKYWLRPMRVSVMDQELRGTAVQKCCNQRHYKPVDLILHYRNGITVHGQLSHTGITRTFHIEAKDLFNASKGDSEGDWALYQQAKVEAFSRIQESKEKSPKLLAHVKEGNIIVSGVMSTWK